MAISYLISLEQLSVLAHFAGMASFAHLPNLPAIDRQRSEELLEALGQQGMIHLRKAKDNKTEDAAAVDMTLAFVLKTMAKPALVVRATGDVLAYCTSELGIVVTPDPRNKSKYRIMPLPDAKELTQRIWELCVKSDSEKIDTILHYNDEEPQEMQLTKPELKAKISEVYSDN